MDQESFGDRGYTAYRVEDGVKAHEAHGVGVYSFFRDHEVEVASGVLAPSGAGVNFRNVFSRHLNGGGSILSAINGVGVATKGEGPLLVQVP